MPAIEHLLAAPERLADVVRQSSDFIGTCNLNGQVMFVNKAGQALVGLHGLSQVRQTGVLDYFLPEDRHFVRDEIFPEILRSRRWAGQRELRFRHFETGAAIPVLWDAFRLDDPHTGAPIGVASISRDNRGPSRVAEQLRASHRQVETILESITDAFYALDQHWRITFINEHAVAAAAQLASRPLTREEVLGQVLWELLPGTRGSPLEQHYRRAVREQQRTVFEYCYPGSDEWFDVHAYPSERGLAIYFQQISDLKRAEREREARARQQALVADLGQRALASDDLQALMDDAVTLVARTLDIELTKIAELLPGHDQKLLVRAGAGWRDGVVGQVREDAGRGSQSGYALLSDGPVIAEDLASEERFVPCPFVLEHGAVGAASVVIRGGGQPFGVLGIYSTGRRSFSESDVNFMQAVANVLAAAVQRSRADEALHEATEAERRRIARDLHDEALQDLTSAIAQATLGSPGRQPAEVLAGLGPVLARVGEQLRGAIYDLRLGEEEHRPFLERVAALVDVHRAMAGDRDVGLEVRGGVPDRSLGERGTEVLRVLGEALTNARRHSGARHIHVQLWGTTNRLYAEVSDDGCGFDATRPAAPDSAGLRGMHERAELLQAQLDILSHAGLGTRVRLELALTHDGAPAQPVRILLVEDHTAVREAIAARFERESDFEVVAHAASLSEARSSLEGVDVAVIDLGLPDGYGADLIPALRHANPRAQALVLSAALDRAQVARAMYRGAAGVLNKTAHLGELVDAVRRIRAGEPLIPLAEVVELVRSAGRQLEHERDDRDAIASLTPREREVLQALADGLNSRDIAQRLHITVRTERNHVASILTKLGMHSQLQALLFALRYGVVEISPASAPANLS